MWFDEIIPFLRPTIIVEVGVWKGAATIHMAELLRRHGHSPAWSIAVDTWLGSWEHWLNDPWFADLQLKSGRPDMQRVFMNNVRLPPSAGLCAAAAARFPQRGAGGGPGRARHRAAASRCRARSRGGRRRSAVWWPQILPGGVLIGDDFHADGRWPGVNAAFNAFTANHGMPYQNLPEKSCCRRRASA